jgi:ABC-2 type transport system ATP-binding protein
MPDAAIQLEGVSKTFDKDNQGLCTAVNNVNLTIAHGQVFGFLGPNGAGKTTTIKMMCSLMLPTSGTIKLNGYDVQKERSKAMEQIGAILDGNRNVYWQLSPWENLWYFGRLKGAWGVTLKKQIESLLHELELWDIRHEPVGQLSRGKQQKVAIACALSANPPIVLFDEPTLGLDINATRSIKAWIKQLAHNYKKTIVITTHQLDIAESVCDQVAIMDKGKLIIDLPTEELLSIFKQDRYEIKISSKIEPYLVEQLARYTIINRNGSLVLEVTDLPELYQALEHLKVLQIELISVKRAKHNLEEVFVQLMDRKE